MSAYRLREWPRLVGAAAVLAALLVAIGILAAGGFSGAGHTARAATPGTTPAQTRLLATERAALAAQARQLTDLRASVASLRARVARDGTALSSLRAQLRSAAADAACWHAKARRPRKTAHRRCTAPPV